MKEVTLLLNHPTQHEHALYRAIIQFCVGVEQGHSRPVMLAESRFLREMATAYIGPETFKDAHHV